MAKSRWRPVASCLRRYVVVGTLTGIPMFVTWLVVKFLFDLLKGIGSPAVAWSADVIQPVWPWMAAVLRGNVFQSILSVVLVFVAICTLGWLGTRVIGRRLIQAFDSLIHRIPFVKTIYGSVKTLLSALQKKPDGVQRVVLIDFPSREMKAVGFVTRTMKDVDTGQELAAVYVPTTPNPTSGYLEIVPLDRVVSTTWTLDEAMQFVVSGGAVAPPEMNYEKSAAPHEDEDKGEDDEDE
jgi:uncharacterized membrane protein